jgi:hypothetical protein
MFGPSQAKGTAIPNIVNQSVGGPTPQKVNAEMPTVAEMKMIASQMRGPEADMLKQMIDAMEKGDLAMKKQLEGFWKMLNGMAESTPEEYKSYIDN